jgi:hypothetical protein
LEHLADSLAGSLLRQALPIAVSKQLGFSAVWKNRSINQAVAMTTLLIVRVV